MAIPPDLVVDVVVQTIPPNSLDQSLYSRFVVSSHINAVSDPVKAGLYRL